MVLSGFGIPSTPEWNDVRLRIVQSAAGAENKCFFPGLLRVMAEVMGLIRICRMINVVPGAYGGPPQPRPISNQEMVLFFYSLR